MRILYVSTAYKPAYRMGGPVASVPATAEALVRAGHEVTVVTTNANLDEDLDVPLNQPVNVDGVTVWYFRREEPLRKWLPFIPYLSQTSGFAYAPDMKRHLRELVSAADVVDLQTPFVYPILAAGRVALRLGKPLFYHQRGNYLPTYLGRRTFKKRIYISLFERPLLKHATSLIALTEMEREAFRTFAPETPCDVVPNGVDVPSADPEAARRADARWRIPDGATVILFLARVEPWKGSDDLLAAFALLQKSHPEAFLIMAGVDRFNVEPQWRGISERDGYGDRLVFTGSLSGQAKDDVLHRADLFALPSSGEGMSMSTLEALAHGCAVMLSPQCNFPEVERFDAGVIVPKNAPAMAEAMDRLLSDRMKLSAMGERGRELALRDYAWPVVAQHLIETYSRLRA